MSQYVITCPSCGTRYSTDPTSIGAEGRSVRCAKCRETWFVAAPAPVQTLSTDPDELALDGLKAEDAVLSAAASPAVEAVSTPDPGRPVPPPTARVGADVMMRDQADAKKLAGRHRTIALIWIVSGLLVLVAIGLAFFNRQEIVDRYPQAATLYNAVGLTVRANGLEIDPPVATTALVDGAPVIRVESTVRNLTRDTRPVPLIELTLHDSSGTSLAQWFVEPPQSVLPGRGRLEFQTEYADPPAGASGLRYRFAEDG